MLALVVLSFVWGGVGLTDPMPKSPEMRTVDASAAPKHVAYEALRQTETGNYAFVLWFGNGTSREREARVRSDTADRQFATVYFREGTSEIVRYGDEGGTWFRRSDGGGWTPASRGWSGDTVFGPERTVLESGADVSLIARNESTAVVRVNDTATAMRLAGIGGDVPETTRASLTLVVDRERGALRRSVFRRSWLANQSDPSSRETSVVVREYRQWGAVDVRRPTGLPYGFSSMLWDMANWCPGCEVGEE